MAVVDKIHRRVLVLPEPLQAEVLDFVEFLLSKVEAELQDDPPDFNNLEWSNMSIAMALRGMEDEKEPNHTLADLKETF